MRFGDRLREERLKNQLTQLQLAKKIGTSRVAITQWENNQTNKIDVDAFLKVCVIFKLNPYEFRFGKDIKNFIPAYKHESLFGSKIVGAIEFKKTVSEIMNSMECNFESLTDYFKELKENIYSCIDFTNNTER